MYSSRSGETYEKNEKATLGTCAWKPLRSSRAEVAQNTGDETRFDRQGSEWNKDMVPKKSKYIMKDIKSLFAKACDTSTWNPALNLDVTVGQGEEEEPHDRENVEVEFPVRVQETVNEGKIRLVCTCSTVTNSLFN